MGVVESAGVEEAGAFANFVVGAGRSGSEENRPEGMLGGSVNEFVVVAELFEQGSDAAFFADPGEGENGDFAGVFVVAGEERQDLFDVPPGPGGDDESVEVLLLKQGLEYSDERITIERGGVSHCGNRRPGGNGGRSYWGLTTAESNRVNAQMGD